MNPSSIPLSLLRGLVFAMLVAGLMWATEMFSPASITRWASFAGALYFMACSLGTGVKRVGSALRTAAGHDFTHGSVSSRAGPSTRAGLGMAAGVAAAAAASSLDHSSIGNSLSDVHKSLFDDDFTKVNPVTGLPMMGGLDAAGNALGMDNMSSHDSFSSDHDFMYVNPATGLAMLDGPGGIDVAGNTFGMDNISSHDSFGSSHECGFSSSSSSDSFGSCFSSDPF